jgi:hypothetical protein
MTPQDTLHSPPLPLPIKDFITYFMQAIKGGRLYSSRHTLFKQSVTRLRDKLQEAVEDRDFFFVGFTADSLLLENDFFPAGDVHGRDFLNLFHSLGISHLAIHKNVTIEELESFVESLSGAESGQGQEVVTALQHENIKGINLGLLDYSVFSGLESAVGHFVQGREEAAIWRQLIFRPALAGGFHLRPDQEKELLRLSDDPENLKRAISELDRSIRSHAKVISQGQRGLIIGSFLQNISKALGRSGIQKRKLFKKSVAAVLKAIRQDVRVSILGAASPDIIEREDGGVLHDLIEDMPEKELVGLLVYALDQGGPQSTVFNNLFRMALARFSTAGPLLSLVRDQMSLATQERKPDSLNAWQHLEQLLIHHQESEEFNAQYRQAIENLATSLKIQKDMIEDEETDRLVRTLAPDSLKLLKASLIIDLLQSSQRGDSMTLPLLQFMGESVTFFLNQGKSRLTGNLLRQVFLSLGRLPQEASYLNEVNSWFRAEEVHRLLKSLFEKCRTYEPREMSGISSICQLFPEKACGFLIDSYLELRDDQSPLSDWLTTTLVSLSTHLPRLISSRLNGAQDTALPRLIDLADLSSNQQITPAIEKLLEHKDYDIRSQAVGCLGRLKSVKSVQPLAQLVLEKSWFGGRKKKALQLEALKALAEIPAEEARAVLQQIASTNSGELQELSRNLLEKS